MLTIASVTARIGMTTRNEMARKPWGEFEELALIEFYPRHGPSWFGWSEVLPSRTKDSISCKAGKIGLKAPNYREPVDDKGEEYERAVDRLMRDGMAPTQIDARMHWVPGTAIKVIKARWEKQK